MKLTDDQFETSFTSAGGHFILESFEEVYDWIKNQNTSKDTLIDNLFNKGFDSKRSGTVTRTSCVIRLINNDAGKEALEKISNSDPIESRFPGSKAKAAALLKKYY